MINILYVLNGCFAKGGIESFILNYYNNIDRNKLHIDFIVHGDYEKNNNNPIHKYLEKRGSIIYYVTPRGKNPSKNRKDIRKILSSTNYDIVHTHMDAAGTFVLKIAKQYGIKVRIAHSHNTAHLLRMNSLKSFFHYLVLEYSRYNIRKNATNYLACSTEAGKWLFGDKNINNGRVVIMKNAIDTQQFIYNAEIRNEYRKKLNLENKFVVGHIGRFDNQKNHNFLIDIFKMVYEKNKNAMLFLIGTGNLKDQIKNKVDSLGLNDNVIFYGNTNEVYKFIQTMDIFILPSLFEGLPVVGIEVQASGIKSIVSNTVSKELKITDNIKFFPLESSAENWANFILEYGNSYERKNMYQEVRAAGYDIETNTKILEDYYSRCISSIKGV